MTDLLAMLRRGLRLPPSGWVLAGILAFYVLAGLFGHDPWKGEDAIHIGVAWHMLHTGDWLTPELAGRAFHEPPLYYWSAAISGHLFGWLLPAHEAMRLASGFWVMLALVGIYYTGRELYGQDSAAASPLLLAGCLGLILHAHDAQPMLIALAAYSGAIGALAAIGRRPRLAGLFYGLAVAGCFLGAGIAPTLPLLAILPLAWQLAPERQKAALALLIGLAIAVLLVIPWPLTLLLQEPARFHAWLAMELRPLLTPFSFPGGGRFLAMLPSFAFPALPLALWALWQRRQQLAAPAQSLPLALLLLTLLMLALAYRPREIPALLLLPPLALLATPGALLLRRGAANAFDWFAMVTFSFFAALVWLLWSALIFGWPEHIAQRAAVLRPGFISHFEPLSFVIALATTLCWIWLISTAPRSPYRGLTHWTLGFTTLWLLLTALALPWFDYDKSYRPVAVAVAAALPKNGCLAERGLSDGQRASLAYFTQIEPAAHDSAAGKTCDWLLLVGDTPTKRKPPAGDWQPVWEGFRPGDKREKFVLLRR
ncbi:MAG: glycosyltransferase family 39 protein [Azonexus sp.]|jgi:4-amino-4-deoxy-L-arabinose transferase-like glycosyltransferase|nr:glycosyltransferase family 39 protein [Azonexus sp.]